jgi:hypothetical protein
MRGFGPSSLSAGAFVACAIDSLCLPEQVSPQRSGCRYYQTPLIGHRAEARQRVERIVAPSWIANRSLSAGSFRSPGIQGVDALCDIAAVVAQEERLVTQYFCGTLPGSAPVGLEMAANYRFLEALLASVRRSARQWKTVPVKASCRRCWSTSSTDGATPRRGRCVMRIEIECRRSCVACDISAGRRYSGAVYISGGIIAELLTYCR